MLKATYKTSEDTKVIEINNDEIIFNAFEANGIELAHGCLSGSCGACRIEILEGAENLSPKGAVEADTIDHISNEYKSKNGEDSLDGKTWRLSCRTKVQGDFSFCKINK